MGSARETPGELLHHLITNERSVRNPHIDPKLGPKFATMQSRMSSPMSSVVQPGDFLHARSKTWLVEDARAVGNLAVLDLVSAEDNSQGEAISLVLRPEVGAQPFDPNDWSLLLRSSFDDPERLGAYLQATEWRTASAADRRLFQAPFRAGIRLDAYQLLPLAKALDLPRVNLLIADDVGLGKTVEAGLIVRELLLRKQVDVVVVSAPASMLLQWQDELAQKFGLDFTIVDREHLLETRRTRGFAANPWSIGSRFIVSHSVLADETYMGGLRDLLGEFRARSMFILDEAHHAAPSGGLVWAIESQMTRAVRETAKSRASEKSGRREGPLGMSLAVEHDDLGAKTSPIRAVWAVVLAHRAGST